MTGQQFITLVRQYTSTTSTTYPDAVALVDTNNIKDKFGTEIEKRNPQFFVVPSLFDIVASSVTAREYPLPDDILSKLVSVEVDLIGTASPLEYIPCRPYAGGMQKLIDDIHGITEGHIAGSFSNTQPYYYLTRRGIYLLSGTTTAITSGGKIRYKVFPADLANFNGSTGLHIDPTTTSFGLPVQFHELWARAVSIVYKGQQPRPIPLSTIEQRFDMDFLAAINSIAADDSREEIFAGVPGINGESDPSGYDHGFNL